jgi:hypothetical protein
MNARLRKVTRNRGQFSSGQAVLKVLYPPSATWPNTAAPTSGSAVRGGNRRCRRSRSTSRDESRPHDRSHDHLHSRSDAPSGSAARGNPCRVGGESVSDRGGGRRKRSGFQFCVPSGFGHGPTGGAARLAAVAGRRPSPAMRRRNLKMIIMRSGASGRRRWRLTANITAVVSR